MKIDGSGPGRHKLGLQDSHQTAQNDLGAKEVPKVKRAMMSRCERQSPM